MALYLLSAPLGLAAVVALGFGSLQAMAANLLALGLMVAAARLNRRAIVERMAASVRRFTRPRRMPYHAGAAIAVAVGTATAAYAGVGHDPLVSLVYAAIAVLGFHLAYGPPPTTAAPVDVPPEIADPAVRRTLAEAESKLVAIEKAALKIGNAELEQRLHDIVQQGRLVLDQLASRPSDVHRARRFFHVHLEGAERVAVHYARTHRLVRGGVLEANFRNVLIRIETAFRQHLEELVAHDLTDLDVRIEVLRQQLRRHGIA